ncbi:flagellar motor switch protein FliG [Tabrizicola sp. WMC-M-20]|nr:flagellar motor switch protein FliG [Tabrizicola sp. WMC-M-20]
MKHARDIRVLSGVDKAAILFLCLGEKRGSALMQQLDEFDIHKITVAMSSLGPISSEMVEAVITEFMDGVEGGGSIVGSFEMAERMLAGFLPEEKVAEIMREIRGPLVGRNLWENFSALNEQVIANYLKGEHDQTVAAILTRLRAETAARVLPLLGLDRMAAVVERMMALESVPRHVLEQLEETVQQDFLVSAARRTGPDPQQRMADLFNKMDNTVFEGLSERLEQNASEAFGAIKQKMFTFDDLIRLDANSLARVMRAAEGNSLPLALRGARKEVRDRFFDSLPARSREMLIEEMANMGPVRSRDVQVAQSALVDQAMELARQEVIRLPMDEDDLLLE